MVDLTRQSLSKLANEVYLKAIYAFRDKDAKALSFHSLKFLQLIKDIDKLLAADDNFLLGTWLDSAKRLSLNAEEMKQVRISFSSSPSLVIQSLDTSQFQFGMSLHSWTIS